MFAQIYPSGESTFETILPIKETRAAVAAKVPDGVTTNVTGVDAIFQSQGEAGGPSVLAETLLGAAGALVILLFVFGTLPAVLMPLLVAVSSILTTFLCVLGLTYVTDVSVVVQFLVALVGLGIAIDYSLLMIFRFREEMAKGLTVDDAIVETMQHAGRSVIVSGTTVAIGLVSMLIIPLPFIRSIGLGGLLIPLVCVLASITLTPALLRLLGPKINRFRVMPKRLLTPDDAESPFWRRWAAVVSRRPLIIFLAGMAIVILLLIPAVTDQSERRRGCPATCCCRRRCGSRRAFRSGDQCRCFQAVHDPRRRAHPIPTSCRRSPPRWPERTASPP